MDKEIWKTINDFPNYKVSNFGNVKRIQRKRYSINDKKVKLEIKDFLLTKIKNYNYYKVYLEKDGKQYKKFIHTLVMDAFQPDKTNFKFMPRENKNNIDINKIEINHIDENGQNNRLDNLEYCTHLYNIHYGKKLKNQQRKILQYDLNGNFIKEWESIKNAEETLNLSNICKCLKNKYKTAGGFIWKYKEE